MPKFLGLVVSLGHINSPRPWQVVQRQRWDEVTVSTGLESYAISLSDRANQASEERWLHIGEPHKEHPT